MVYGLIAVGIGFAFSQLRCASTPQADGTSEATADASADHGRLSRNPFLDTPKTDTSPDSTRQTSPTILFHGTVPCGPSSFVPDMDPGGLGICTTFGEDNHLFHITPTGTESLAGFSDWPDHLVTLGAHTVVSAMRFSMDIDSFLAWGLLHQKSAHAAWDWHPLPTMKMNGYTSTANEVRSLASIGETVYVLTGNGLPLDPEPAPTIPTVLAFSTATGFQKPLPLNGLDPIAMGVLPGATETRLIVTGNQLGPSGLSAWIYVIRPSPLSVIQTFPLPMPLSPGPGELAIAAGRAVLSMQPSTQLALLHAENATPVVFGFFPKPGEMPTVSILEWQADGKVLVAADSSSGRLARWDTSGTPPIAMGPIFQMDTQPQDINSLSAAVEMANGLYVAVGGQLFRLSP